MRSNKPSVGWAARGKGAAAREEATSPKVGKASSQLIELEPTRIISTVKTFLKIQLSKKVIFHGYFRKLYKLVVTKD